VILAGAGPGDPELITLKAAKALGQAEAVVYDRLANPDLLKLAPKSARFFDARKLPGRGAAQQEAINRLLVRLAGQGLRVVRLKGGDPYTFARGGEEALAVRAAGHPCSVIPGVTSGLAALAAAGIPVTHRGLADSVVLATGRVREGEPGAAREAALAKLDVTLVYYMGVENAGLIARRLIKAGANPLLPAAAVQRGTWPDQRVVDSTLGGLAADLKRHKVKAPAILVIGRVAGLRSQLADAAPALPLKRRRSR
jgi:uroporphyrin-III C-methyltransferase